MRIQNNSVITGKIVTVLLVILSIWSCNKKDTYTEKIVEGHIELNTQFQVDSFGKLGYTDVKGTVVIGNYINPNHSITNLDALSELRKVNDLIINYNNGLENIDGLFNLKEVDAQLIISNNPKLEELNGLANLKSVGAILEISKNASLRHIDGLSNMEVIGEGGNIRIWGNTELENLDGLKTLKAGGWTYIYGNPVLKNIEGLKNIREAIYVYISNNPSLESVDGLCRLSKLVYELEIIGNENLSDFCGIKKLLKNDPPKVEDYKVYGNAFNPSQEDIIKGNCD